jgi:predicted nucleic acid-binding protein
VIVVDASAWVRALMDSGTLGDAARRILSEDPDWMVPAHAPLEVLCTIRRYEATQLVTSKQATEFANAVVVAELRFGMPDEWLLSEVWSYRHNLSVYDAPYVALAARYAVALVTFDVRLAKAARAVGVEDVVPAQR